MEIAKRNLHTFVRLAWAVSNPYTPFLDSWHLGCICFPAGTPIVTENGVKPIEDVRAGDNVLSLNHSSNELEWRSVLSRMRNPGKEIVRIKFPGGGLELTSDHPVFIQGRGYISAIEVRPGSVILKAARRSSVLSEKGNASGSYEVVESIVSSVERTLRVPEETFNIEVDGNNNYFAGGVLVHNCEHLEALTRCQILRLVINLPPRCLKSWICSVFWPAWVWLRDPGSDWFYASYDDSLSKRDGVRERDLVKSSWYKESFGIKWTIKSDVDAKDFFQNTVGGQRLATTPESKGAGFDADYTVVDDAHNVREARNHHRLESTCDWYGKTLGPRGNNQMQYRQLVVGQRIAKRDLYGYLIGMGYESLILPMEYEPKRFFFTREEAKASTQRDPIIATSVQRDSPTARDPRTKDGELIHAARFPIEIVHKLKAELGTQAAGQLQQRPGEAGGTVFQSVHFRYFDMRRSAKHNNEWVFALCRNPVNPDDIEIVPVKSCSVFQCIDTATTAKSQTSSKTAVGTFAVTPLFDLLVFDMFQARLEVPYQYPAIRKLAKGQIRWNEEEREIIEGEKWPFKLKFQGVEPKSSGIGLIQLAANDGRPFRILDPGTVDKVGRSSAVATMYYNGKVFHKIDAPWRVEFEEQITLFPTGDLDDMVDVLSYAGTVVSQDPILRGGTGYDPVIAQAAAGYAQKQKDEEGSYRIVTSSGEEITVELD